MNKKILGIILIFVLAASLCGIAFAAEIGPAPPTMKLTVEFSPLDVYPPYLIYTAQLSYMPPINSTMLKADFYHFLLDSPVASVAPVYLGSATFDKTGKAVLWKQINRGAYSAFAKTAINGVIIYSNKVEYKVP